MKSQPPDLIISLYCASSRIFSPWLYTRIESRCPGCRKSPGLTPGNERADSASDLDERVASDIPQSSILALCQEKVLNHGDTARRRGLLTRQPVGVTRVTRRGCIRGVRGGLALRPGDWYRYHSFRATKSGNSKPARFRSYWLALVLRLRLRFLNSSSPASVPSWKVPNH
jgi:hypothetical protein